MAAMDTESDSLRRVVKQPIASTPVLVATTNTLKRVGSPFSLPNGGKR